METKYKNAKREMNKILHAYVTKEKNFPILRISDTDKEKNKNKSKKNKNKRSNRRGVRKTDTEQSIMQDGEPNVLDTSLSNQLHVLAKERSNKGSQSSQMQQQYVDQGAFYTFNTKRFKNLNIYRQITTIGIHCNIKGPAR